LQDIAAFIDEGGVFPTNIVINFQRQGNRPSGVRFDHSSADASATPGSRLGYLTIPPIYQCAWIIDGQHRLFAYADHRWADTASLTVTAFDGLSADKQADLFEKINSKQKKVSANLLAELFSTLHWNSSDQKLQVRAICSQIAQDLRAQTSSPLYGRVLSADEKGTQLRCITLTTLVSGLQRPGVFIRSEERGHIRQYGVLWAGGPDASYQRALAVASAWFESIKRACPEMWARGNDPTLGLAATNLGIDASLRILSWALLHLRRLDSDVDTLPNAQLISRLTPFAGRIGAFFDSLGEDDVRQLRRLYGTGGRADMAYGIGKFIREEFEDFAPDGLLDWIDSKSRVDVNEAQRLCTELERRIIDSVIGRLKQEYGEDGWWRELPLQIRKDAAARREEESDGHPLESFLYLIDLRSIVTNKWQLFQSTHAIGSGSKDEKTKWLVELNDIRRRADHAAGARLKAEDLDTLRSIDASLQQNGI
jgi:DNA sulfur modification protein DndB